MSDGNFNTKLLPPGNFAGGIRTGEARMRQKALGAFDAVMQDTPLAPAEVAALKRRFHDLLATR